MEPQEATVATEFISIPVPAGMNTFQAIQLELMRQASFNAFDGDRVVDDLLAHRDLWKAAMMGRFQGFELITLRDLPLGVWSVDTLMILAAPGHEDELYKLAEGWEPDELDWISSEHAAFLLGAFYVVGEKTLLRVWWD